MKKIVNVDLVLEALGHFSICDFPIVRELRFFESFDGSERTQRVLLRIESERLNENYLLSVMFDGVINLRLSGFGNGTKRIEGLQIDDVSANQLEGVRWEIYSVEDVSFGFCAKTAEICSITKITPECGEASEK